ncbi:uncharacterized protein LOC111321587 isoform X1 [Stylophora pistillata]|uniref:uncharacterized protein LOC111321587 isoform X1 n=1 Tax=Stylophora pistillata TaxID=50429 RepID=UPI000C041C14|nr:uncharacterized protein LOC111321587 isoform X1 [Stylophora pistillata]XP_022780252.1 uncharacterized protein LOC111321587 isoform X1 [Stylophora pistillata]XP_022780253.1 uncharacterized protein LOC111321587 isoform X1 [Stylophora pistillata]
MTDVSKMPSNPSSFFEDKGTDDFLHDQDDKPVKFGKIVDPHVLGCCEFCGGPVKRRRYCSPVKRFCSKGCSRSSRKANQKKKEGEDNGQDSDEGSTTGVTEGEAPHKFTWSDYMEAALSKAAPDCCFKHATADVPGLKPGMKLEAVDRNNPPSFCVATVIQQVGHRVRIRYDGFGKDNSNDCWCNFQAEELHPIGWCAQNGYPLQPPKGINSTLEDWRTFLTQTLTGALAAPHDLFRKTQEHFQPRVHGFEISMKLEAVHPMKPSIICPATVTKSLGPYYFAVTTDYQEDVPAVTFCCHSDSPGIFPAGWCSRHQVDLSVPGSYTKKTFAWDKYLAVCRSTFAPPHLFRKMKAHKFKPGMKLEVVDLEKPHIIRVATITNIMGRMLQLFFDGQSKFQFVDFESPDIYPIGWCKRTAHILHTPFGTIPSDASSSDEEDTLVLPSFLEVMGRQNQTQSGQQAVGILPRKIPAVSKIEKDDKSPGEESDISDDDTGSERFYHNKNQIFFNKSCCYGPLLDPDKVSQLPEATPPGKVSSVIRTGLEMVAKAAYDPEKVIDLMQEGCGVRVVVKHKGKILKKAISRVDSRPKLERYLKRFCRRLICCEFFLSLKPVPTPCPDRCQADDQGNLQGPKGLKAKRSREYFEVKHLGVENKKRGRKRKSEYLLPGDPNNVASRTLVENGISIAGASFNVAQGQKITSSTTTATTTILPAQNVTVTSQTPGTPVVIPQGVSPGVSASAGTVGNVGFQVPGNVTVPHLSSTTAKSVPLLAPQGKVPLAHSQRGPVPINALPGGKPVMKEGGQTHNPSGASNTISLPDGTSRIVTNVSSQRFATSATSSGTTITFGRAPPNVTISNCTPPPLTKIATEASSSHVATSTNMAVEPANQLAIHAVSAIQTASSVSVPPPYSTSSVHGPPISRASYGTATTGQLSVNTGYRPAAGPPVYPRQVLSPNPGGVIRHPGVHATPPGTSSAVPIKPGGGTPPPPPLVPNARIGQGGRPQGMYVQAQPNSSSMPPPRPGMHTHPPSYNPIAVRTGVVNHHPQGNAPPPSLSSSSGVSSGPHHPGSGERVVSQAGVATMSQRPIMPNYPGIPRSINPGMSPRNTPLRFSSVRASLGGGYPRHPPHIRPQGGAPLKLSPHQQSFKLPFPVPTVSGNVQRSVGSSLPGVTLVDSVSMSKSHLVPTPIQPKSSIEHLQALTNSTDKDAKLTEEITIKEEQEEEEERKMADEGGGGGGKGEEGIENKSQSPPKRNLWWLKKKRRKRTRLTYIKSKCRRKDEEGAPSTSEVAAMEEEVELDDLPKSPSGERPKRGRPPKGIGFRFKTESFSNSDPDWDETEERRRVKPIIKKRKGRMKKDSNEVTSPKLKSPGMGGPLQIPMIPGVPVVRDLGTAVPSGSTAPIVRSPPVSRAHSHHGTGTPGGKRITSPKGAKLMRMSSATDPTGHHSTSRYSPYNSPTSNSPFSPLGNRPIRPKPFCVDVGTNTSLPGCVNGRSPDLPANPSTWSVEQVVRYVRSTDCLHYANIFLDQEIDGQALMLLSRDSLMQFTRMKLGPTLKMCSYIAQLKLRAR